MANIENISKKLFEVISKFSKKNQKELTVASRLREDLGIDSVDALDLIFLLEKEFNIVIEMDDISKFLTIRDIEKELTDKLHNI